MKNIITSLLFFFIFTNSLLLTGQSCSIEPNTKVLIEGNGVKKQTIIVADKFAHTKFVQEVLFFDSAGTCYKRVWRDSKNVNPYQYSKWSDASPTESFIEYGYYNADSVEVMTYKQIYYYGNSEKVLKETVIVKSDPDYTTYVTEYQYDNKGERYKSFWFQLNSKNDTIKKTNHINNNSIKATPFYIWSNGKWEEQSTHVSINSSSTIPDKNQNKNPSPTKKPKPHFEPKTITTYLDPEGRTQPGMVEYFDETGLITKRDVLWDGKIYTWQYEFY